MQTDERAAEIKGTITLADGTVSEFHIIQDGGWQQWGKDRARLTRSLPIVEAMAAGLLDADLLTSDYDDEDEGGEQTAGERTWTFFGHWDEDEIVVDYVKEGVHQDDREDLSGAWPQGLWAAHASGATVEEAEANAKAEYEHHDNYL